MTDEKLTQESSEKSDGKDKIQKKDFVEISYTGYSNGEMFDSNIEEDLKKINPEGKPNKTIIVVGENMVVPGLDKAIEGKEIGKEYNASFKAKEGFGERKRELVRTIPMSAFKESKVNPKPGMVLSLDNNLVKIIAVSGGRVIADFNNPLSGKDLEYKFTIVRKVNDEKEKVESLFEGLLRFKPEFEIKDKIIVKGGKGFEVIVNAFNDKFKDLIGKELDFEEKSEVNDEKEKSETESSTETEEEKEKESSD